MKKKNQYFWNIFTTASTFNSSSCLINLSLCASCYSCLDKASVVTKADYEIDGSFTRNPWELCSVTRVEEVKMVIKLLPIWATTILFWSTYAQMITFSVEQASTMERSIGHFQIPAGSLTVFFVAAILLTLGVYDRVIIPLCKRWKGKPGKRSSSQKLYENFNI